MPNWVTNKLSIRGTDNQIEQILSAIAEKEKTDAISRSPIDFNNIIPMPEDLNILLVYLNQNREKKSARLGTA